MCNKILIYFFFLFRVMHMFSEGLDLVTKREDLSDQEVHDIAVRVLQRMDDLWRYLDGEDDSYTLVTLVEDLEKNPLQDNN